MARAGPPGVALAWRNMSALPDIKASDAVAVIAIIDAGDLATLEKLRAILPEGALRPVRLPLTPVAPAFTGRQAAILPLLATNLSNKEIGRRLAISHFTVRNHVSQILRALGVATRRDARVAIASLARADDPSA